MEDENKFENESPYLYENSLIPVSNIIYEFKKKNFIIDDFIFKIRDDGIVIEGRYDKQNSEYFPWELFKSFNSKSINKNKLMLIFNDGILDRNQLGFLDIPFKRNFKGSFLNFIRQKLKEEKNLKVKIVFNYFRHIGALFLILILVLIKFKFISFELGSFIFIVLILFGRFMELYL